MWGYAVGEANGMYHLMNGKLQWEEPQDENAHFEVAVRDGADGRFIPQLTVYATLVDSEGTERSERISSGSSSIRACITTGAIGGHRATARTRCACGSKRLNFTVIIVSDGKRYAEPVEVEFSNVEIQTGQS